MNEVKSRFILISLAISLITYFLPIGLDSNQQLMLSVTVLIVSLWITEAVPLHATSILAALLLILVVGVDSSKVFSQFFDPVIVLLLGGFVIAVALVKFKLDEYFAYKILGKADNNPSHLILALIFVTTFLSMWISNSAAAAIIMPIALVMLRKNKLKMGTSKLAKACVLAVAFGATIGGIGTIIGSVPNLIAAKFLVENGNVFGFYQWFVRGFPFMFVLMILTWIILSLVFKSEKKKVIIVHKKMSINHNQKLVLLIFLITIILWITESFHGISSSVIALVPIILLYFTGLLNTADFKKIDWPTLILIGGGLALGLALQETDLVSSFANVIDNLLNGSNVFILFLLLGAFGVLLTIFVSNTTAAVVYLPIVVALASSLGINQIDTVVAAAIGVSLDFVFPFGTPPTAIAHSTKYVSMKDIAKAGILVSIAGIILLGIFGKFWVS